MDGTDPRAQQLFEEMMAVAPARRRELAQRACGNDTKLLKDVESLLAAYGRAGDFLNAPTGPIVPAGEVTLPSQEAPGTRIGPYRLLQQIGEGGFGSVFLADQEKPLQRRVALKIIKLGMDTKQVIARFEAERQALALMDHPNIAQVFDGGATAAGRPYFVMELVKGDPITTYCDKNSLGIPERLELFVQVCHAVQHAHQKGIIHRDIKPSNILVATREGRPFAKIIDFGIAKATSARLTEKTLFTEHRLIVGTPEYMSPEQAEGSLDIDTRTDVYSLGVLLYELLTGVTPFDSQKLRSAAYAEIQRIIREVEPPKPSTRLSAASETLGVVAARRRVGSRKLGMLVRGELDWIVMKALDKDRGRRYESPSAMAIDVVHHLAGEAVVAAPPSATYQIRKFLRRNRQPVFAASGVLLALILGLGGTLWMAQKVSLERDGQRRLAIAEAAARQIAEQKTAEANRSTRRAERVSYIANITAADAAYRVNEMETVRSCLEACEGYLRNWEWRYLCAANDQSLFVIGDHARTVTDAKYSADGTRLVTASADHSACVREAATGRALSKLVGHTDIVSTVCLSPDGTRVATGSYDGTARVWESSSGKSLAVLRGHQAHVNWVVFSPDGTRVATASTDKTVRVWDVKSGDEQYVIRGHEKWVSSVEFSPDASQLATVSRDLTVRVWNAATGAQESIVVSGQDVRSATFSPDGKWLIGGRRDATACIWDITTGREIAVFRGHDELVLLAVFSRDGTRIASASRDNTARIWDVASGKELAVLRGHADVVTSVAFSPDGNYVLTASRDATARVWGLSCGALRRPVFGRPGDVNGATLNADGTRNVTMTAALSRDGSRLLAVPWKNEAYVWDVLSGEEVAVLRGHQRNVTAGAFFPDGQRIVTASLDGSVRVWSTSSDGEIAKLDSHTDGVECVDVSADGERLVSASRDGTARVWDTHSWKPVMVLRGHQGVVYAARFSPDGAQVVTASHDSSVRLWDAATGGELRVFSGHSGAVCSAMFSQDGLMIVSASHDGSVRVWDVNSGASLGVIRGPRAFFTASFSPDGTRIVAGSEDGITRLWDLPTYQEVAKLRGTSGVAYSCAFSADGSRVIVAWSNQTTEIWDTMALRDRLKEAQTAQFAR